MTPLNMIFFSAIKLVSLPDARERERRNAKRYALSMKFRIVSLGCPKNLVESEFLAGVLEQGGHNLAERM